MPIICKCKCKMRRLHEERSEKGRGRIKMERKGQQQEAMKKITKVAIQRSDEWYGIVCYCMVYLFFSKTVQNIYKRITNEMLINCQ